MFSSIWFSAFLLLTISLANAGLFNRISSAGLLAGLLGMLVSYGFSLMRSLRDTGTAGGGFSAYGVRITLCVVALSVWARWLHPTENILGGNDEGVYAATSAHLAQSGGYYLNSAGLAGIPESLRPWIVKQTPAMAVRTAEPPPRFSRYHACLFVDDIETGRLSSQFPLGHPSLLASAYSWCGFTGVRWINPALMLLNALLAAGLVARWVGIWAGTVAFLSFLWFPLNVWIGNSLFAEPLLMCLWLLALTAFAERTHTPVSAGIVMGLALGLSPVVKIDALPVVVAGVMAGVACFPLSRKFSIVSLLAICAGATLSLISLWRYNRGYTQTTLQALSESSSGPFMAGAAIVILGMVVWLTSRKWAPDKIESFRIPIVSAIVAVCIGLAVYAYFLRPGPSTADSFYYWPYGKTIKSFREDTFFRLGWYFQPWGLAIAVLGAAYLCYRARELWQILFVGVGVFYLIYFCYDLRNNPLQPYGLRRLIPFGLPVLLVGIGAVVPFVSRWAKNRVHLIAVALCAAVGMAFYWSNERLNRDQEFPGLIDQVEHLASSVPARSVVLVAEGTGLARLATPMELIFGRPAPIFRAHGKSFAFEEGMKGAIRNWQRDGRDVFLLNSDDSDGLHLFGVKPTPFYSGEIVLRYTQQSSEQLVTEQKTQRMPFTLLSVPKLISPAPEYGAPKS